MRFEPLRFHAVLPVLTGIRYSVTLFVPGGLHRLDEDTWSALRDHFHCDAMAKKYAQAARMRQHGTVTLAAEPQLTQELLIQGWCDDELSDIFLSRQSTRLLRQAARELWNARSVTALASGSFFDAWPRECRSTLIERLMPTTLNPNISPWTCFSQESVLFLCGDHAEFSGIFERRIGENLPTWWLREDTSESEQKWHEYRLSGCGSWSLLGTDLDLPIPSGPMPSKMSQWCHHLSQAVLMTVQIQERGEESEQAIWLNESATYPIEPEEQEEQSEEAQDAVDEQDEEVEPAECQQEGDTLTTAEKELVHKVHVNAGHPTREHFHRALAAAGCRPSILRYIKRDYERPQCLSGARQQLRRKISFPRTFQFGKLVGLDTFYIDLCSTSSDGTRQTVRHPVLNMVDHGTNLQQCQVMSRATALEASRAFREVWIRPHGTPEAILADGGPEFQQSFAEMCERMSILLIITDPESPWQAGRVERHGGWVKELAEAEISSRQLILKDGVELNAFLCELTAAKNAHFNRGGYTPLQLVYGRNPQIPGELLGQGEISQLASTSSYPQDSPADQKHFRAQQIRHRARELAFTHQCRNKFNIATRTAIHQDRSYAPGQWVFVWRKAQASHRAHMQHRSGSWRGPGLVILQQGHTVYVSMRSRLWKCNIDQIRNAGSAEMLGAELVQRGQLRDLLLHLHSTRGATAIDCTTDGAPDSTEESDALRLDEAASSIVPLGSNTQLPPQVSSEHPPLMPMTSVPQNGYPLPLPLSSVPEDQDMNSSTLPQPVVEIPRQTSTSTTAHTLREPEPMDDASSTRTRPDSESHRSEAEDRRETAKMARTQSRDHASSTAASATGATSSQAVGAPSTESTPWLRLTMAERQSALRELERLPECLRAGPVNQSLADQAADGSENLMVELGMSFVSKSNVDQASGITRERAKALGEVRLEDLSDDLRESFKEADMQEWEGIKKVVKIHLGPAADALRAQWPDRVISGRMVRRLKAQPGIRSDPKAKSRFCCHGHKDPDTGRMRIFAPTPPVETLMLFSEPAIQLFSHRCEAGILAE
eukprot:5738574-Amphidinium_carterae.2